MLADGYRRIGAAIGLCLILVLPALQAWQHFHRSPRVSTLNDGRPAEFHFTRLVYSGRFGRWGWRGGWATDYPEAEYHFMQGVRRLTNVHASAEGRLVRPLDEELFEYPWLYAVEVGRWNLDTEEAAHLKEYLLRGGFLMVDDFHGSYEWTVFLESMKRVFPERPILEIDQTEPLLNVLYDLNHHLAEGLQIPGVHVIRSGRTWEKGGYDPHWRGIFDDEGRLMVAINFNMDLGDAWEHADTPQYPEKMTALAYRFGINYIIYAMTH